MTGSSGIESAKTASKRCPRAANLYSRRSGPAAKKWFVLCTAFNSARQKICLIQRNSLHNMLSDLRLDPLQLPINPLKDRNLDRDVSSMTTRSMSVEKMYSHRQDTSNLAKENVNPKVGINCENPRAPQAELATGSVEAKRELTQREETETAELEDGMLRNTGRQDPEAQHVHQTLDTRTAPKARQLKTPRRRLAKNERGGKTEGENDESVGFAHEEVYVEEQKTSNDKFKDLEEKVAILENVIQRLSFDGGRNLDDIKGLEERVLVLENNVHGKSQNRINNTDNTRGFSLHRAAQNQPASIFQGKATTIEAETFHASLDRDKKGEDIRDANARLSTENDKVLTSEGNIAELVDIVDKIHTERKQQIRNESQQESSQQQLQKRITELGQHLSGSSSRVEKENEDIEALQAQVTVQLQQVETTSRQLTKLEDKISEEMAPMECGVVPLISDLKEKVGELAKLKVVEDQKSHELKERDENIRALEEHLAKLETQPDNDSSIVLRLQKQLQAKSQELWERDSAVGNPKYQQAQQAIISVDELESLEKSSDETLRLVVAEKDREVGNMRAESDEQIPNLVLEKAETERLQALLKESSLAISEKDLEIESIRKAFNEEIRQKTLERQESEKIKDLFEESSLKLGKKAEEIENIKEELKMQTREAEIRTRAIGKLSKDHSIVIGKKDEEIRSLETSLHNRAQAVIEFRKDLEALRLRLQQKTDEHKQQAEQIEELRRKAESSGQQKRDVEQLQSVIERPNEELLRNNEDRKQGTIMFIEDNTIQGEDVVDLHGQLKGRELEVERLLQQIEAHKAEIIVQRGKVKKYQMEIEGLRNAHQASINEGTTVSAMLQEELNEVRKQLASDQTKHVEEMEKINLGYIRQLEQVSGSKDEVRQLQLALEKMQEKQDTYVQAIFHAEDELKNKEEMQGKLLLELDKIRSKHKKQLTQTAVQRDQVKQLQLEVERLEKTKIVHAKEISDAQDELEGKKAAEGKLSIEIDKLRGDNEDLHQKLESLKKINEGLIAGKAEETLRADIALKDARITELNRKLSQQDRSVRGAQDAALKMVEMRRSQKLHLPDDKLFRETLEVHLETRPKEWARKYALTDFSDMEGKANPELEDQLAVVAGEGKGLKDLSQKYEPDIVVTALLLQYIKGNVLSKPFLAFWDEGGVEFAVELMRCYDDLFACMLIATLAYKHLLTETVLIQWMKRMLIHGGSKQSTCFHREEDHGTLAKLLETDFWTSLASHFQATWLRVSSMALQISS